MQLGVCIWIPGSGFQVTYTFGWTDLLLAWLLWYWGEPLGSGIPRWVRETVDYWWQIHLWRTGQTEVAVPR